MTIRLAFILVIACIPSTVSASIVINEFLYDAEGTDTDKEFVEIYNDGSDPIDLTKWKIFDGSNHTFNVPPKNGGTGSITLPAGGYALLVNDASAFLALHNYIGTVIDTVLSLGNTSATISLIDENGAITSSISYTKDQGGNGDGNSLQRKEGSWIVASPTMGVANASTPGTPDNSSTATTTATSTSQTTTTATSTTATQQTSEPSYIAPPPTPLFADGGDDRTVIVGADTDFYGRAYNRKQEIVEQVRFSWNFGDGTSFEGANAAHHYEYPGRYAVVLTISQNRAAASDYIVVTAEPARLSFVVHPDSSVSIQNHAGRDLNLSRWSIKSYGQLFVLPEDSIVLSGSTMRISNKTIGFTVGPQTELLYPNGLKALDAGEIRQETVATAPAPLVVPVAAVVKKPVTKPSIRIQTAQAAEEEESDVPEGEALTEKPTISQAAAVGLTGSSWYWWIGALGFAGVAFAGASAAQRYKRKEWTIIEQSDEGV